MSARRRRRAGSARRTGCAVLVALAFLALGVGGVVWFLTRTHPPAPFADRCDATVDGQTWSLSTTQAENAALIAGLGVQRELPARAVTIALATAMQESRLVNVDYGDRDSLGLFQQRPSQGWGTVEQVQDPLYAAGTFYDHLIKVPGYRDLPVTEAAQAVQRSGFPDAYAQHEETSRAWASALTGNSPGALTCTLHDAAPSTSDAVVARIQRDLGSHVPVEVTPIDGGATLTFPTSAVTSVDDAGERDWALAQWAVAVSDPLGLTSVSVGDQTWDRAGGTWGPSTTPVPAGTVSLTITT
ncbi:hypothetical protein [Cellulomonas sp. URHD0024]|uniref:hypothetical protein n=1 Tax=Cellulomonas sp. URHD0024 TaxID=1302620 RepID=UPI00042008D3|nr:hypothetical protein [Cellulomonas sp. URHD0024]